MRHSEGEPLGWDLERDRRDEPYEILRRPPRTIGRPRVATESIVGHWCAP